MRSPTANSQFAHGENLAAGEVIGDFRVTHACGFSTTDIDSRGFAIAAALYRAQEISSGLPVLLKVLKRPYRREDPYARRFIREGRRVAGFVHPNVVSVYDAGFQDGYLYLALQAVDGERMDHRIQAGLSAAEALALLAPLAQALDAAHAAGFVHGGVTPGAVRIDEDGVPHLAALAIMRAPPGISVAGAAAPKLGYAAPEQLCGLRLTGAADIYSLTAILLHCLTGVAPFPMETTAATQQARIEAPTPTLTSFTAACAALNRVIARGMAKDPAARYREAQTLIDDAAVALADLPPQSPRNAPAFAILVPDEQQDRACEPAAAASTGRATPSGIAADGPDGAHPVQSGGTRSRPAIRRRRLAILFVFGGVAVAAAIAVTAGSRPPGPPATTMTEPRTAHAIVPSNRAVAPEPDALLAAALSHEFVALSDVRTVLDGLATRSLRSPSERSSRPPLQARHLPSSPRSAHRIARGTSATPARPAAPAAPAVEHASTPATGPVAAAPAHQVAAPPPTSQPASAPSSTSRNPSSPTVVVVPAGSGATSHAPTQPGTVVVVPAG